MKLFGVLSGLAAAGIWGGMYVVSDVVLQTVPPFTLLTIRLLLGAVSLAAMAWAISRRASPPLPPGDVSAQANRVPLLALIGFVGYGLSLGLQLWGTDLSTAANGALITTAAPAFIAVFAYWLLGERLTLPRLLALVLATVGVVIVVFDPEGIRLGAEVLWGNVALFCAAVTWGLYSVLVKRATIQGIPTLTITVMAPAGGLLLAVPMMLWELTAGGEQWGRIIEAMTPDLTAGILFLGIICTALAVYLWNKAFEILDATVASLLLFAQPILGAVLSAWLLKTPLGLQFFVGGGLILVAVCLISLERPRS